MFYKTITKNFVFVISLLFVCIFTANCEFVHSNGKSLHHQNKKEFSDRFEKPQVLGEIKSNEIKESSGLVASRCNEGVFWTHNDSGDKNLIYAINKKGDKLGTFEVTGAENDDWEDIATLKDKNGICYLYIGDIGDNELKRGELTVYKVKEPKVTTADKSSDKKNPRPTEKAEAVMFEYSNGRHNAETLLIHPETEDIYVLTKVVGGASRIHKLSGYKPGVKNKTEEIGRLSVPAIPSGVLTGGEISPDGSRVVICDYFNGYELVLPKDAKNFDGIWRDEPSIIDLGKREQGEAVCYGVDGGAVYATSEKKDSPFIEVKRAKK